MLAEAPEDLHFNRQISPSPVADSPENNLNSAVTWFYGIDQWSFILHPCADIQKQFFF